MIMFMWNVCGFEWGFMTNNNILNEEAMDMLFCLSKVMK